jgi:uncharacterized protein (DUF1330 family)
MSAAYLIADVSITDAAKMALYREWSTKAIQEHGAEVLVRGGTIETLEGDWQPQRMVLLRFADMDTARRFYSSETYVHARSLREGAGVLRMVIVEGMA